MSLHWNVVFLLMIIEVVITLILIFPFPNRVKLFILNCLSIIWKNTFLRTIYITCFVAIAILFLDSQRDSYKFGQQLKEQHGADVKMGPNVHTRLLGAQRNGYLSGFTLFLLLILYHYSHMLENLVDLERKVTELSAGGRTPVLSEEISSLTKRNDTLEKENEVLRFEKSKLADELAKPVTLKKTE
eukprot:TRINITY_DN298_c0_g2_i1.p1 TRINITY_DN298_c0_g2~~TRINITY_DN298_c0_g2_i1.p1  ORF type:complete len:202 (-),score=89.28 TRINITY_DN298_c0_g2_i1:81-638(-)